MRRPSKIKWLVWREPRELCGVLIYSGAGRYRTSVLDMVPSHAMCEIIEAPTCESAMLKFMQRHPAEDVDNAT